MCRHAQRRLGRREEGDVNASLQCDAGKAAGNAAATFSDARVRENFRYTTVPVANRIYMISYGFQAHESAAPCSCRTNPGKASGVPFAARATDIHYG